MRRFAEGEFVYTFDFTLAQESRSYRAPRQNVRNATVFRGFYTDEYEKKLSQQFEQGVREIADKITARQQLALDERITLSRYIHAYRVRSPWMLRQLQKRYEADMRDITQEFTSQWSFLQESLRDMEAPIDENFSKEMTRVLESRKKELDDPRNMQAAQHSYFSEGMQLAVEPQDANSLLAWLPWRVFVSEGHHFVLGDHFFELNGLDQPIFELYFPISATHCLFISRYAPYAQHRQGDIEYIPIDERTTRAINVRTVAAAERYVISGKGLSWVRQARRTPPEKHLQLSGPYIQTEQLVGNFISSRCPRCWWMLTDGPIVGRQMAGLNDQTARVNTFTQRVCTNRQCGFTTTFQNWDDTREEPLGSEAAKILRRLRPSDRGIPPLEETEEAGLLAAGSTPISDAKASREYSHEGADQDFPEAPM